MTTWRDVKWEHYCGRVYAQDSKDTLVCIVPESLGSDRAIIGRAIAHAWNVDLAAAQSWRELFAVDDSVVKV